MKILFVIVMLFVVCMITQCLLGMGDNLISALSSNLKSLWDISPLELSAIYSIPYAIGLLACLGTGWLIPCLSIRYLMILAGTFLFVGLCGMFAAMQIGIEGVQIAMFTAARVLFQCGYFPMSIGIDYIMSMCYKHYNEKHSKQNEENQNAPWYQRLYRSFSLSFGMIGAMQTYSDYGGKMLADLTLPLLSLDSLKTAMSSMVAVAILLLLCIVAINYFTEAFHIHTGGTHRMSQEGVEEEDMSVDWTEYFRKHYVTFPKAIGVLILLNFIWVGSWNAFLMSMPQVWKSLFSLTAFEAPVYVGYGILASCIVGGAFSILPPSPNILRLFAFMFGGIAVPTFVGLLLPDVFHYPLMLSIMVCCIGSMMNIVIMMLIPFLFRNFDFAMTFVWLEFSRTIGSIIMPVAFGFILTADQGAILCVVFFATLVAFGYLIYCILMRMAIQNIQIASRAASQDVSLPIEALVDYYESASDLSSSDPSTPRFRTV